MLIDEPEALRTSPILAMIGGINGLGPKSIRIRKGVYEINHFGSTSFLREYNEYPTLSIGAYGVCDNIRQIFKKCPELEASKRQFVVTVTPVRKENQPSEGGWRWHKWGEYIGTQRPQCEYIYDEEDIDEVLIYHIYEKKNDEDAD